MPTVEAVAGTAYLRLVEILTPDERVGLAQVLAGQLAHAGFAAPRPLLRLLRWRLHPMYPRPVLDTVMDTVADILDLPAGDRSAARDHLIHHLSRENTP